MADATLRLVSGEEVFDRCKLNKGLIQYFMGTSHSILRRATRKAIRLVKEKVHFGPLEFNVAIVGCGRIAVDHYEALNQALLVRVVGMQDTNLSVLATVKSRWPNIRAFRDLDQLLADVRPDALTVCTWPDSHAQIVATAARAGVKGILCEKPLALNMDDIRVMQDTCAHYNAKLAGGHQYRFHPAFIEARRLIRDGALGRVHTVSGNIVSSLANNGPHLVDSVRFLLGDIPATYATARCERAQSEVDRGIPVESRAEGRIGFQDGIVFDFRTGDWSSTFFGITVTGDANRLDVSPSQLLLGGKTVYQIDPNRAVAECRKRQFGEFIRWTRGRQTGYSADGEQSARSAELVLALYESARLAETVTLPLRNSGDVIRQLYDPEPSVDCGGQSDTRPTVGQPLKSNPSLAIDGGHASLRRWPHGRPHLGIRELASLARVIHSKELCAVGGTKVAALECQFAGLYGSSAAVASTSGTAAIHTALATINPEPGDEIITTPMSDMGTVIPILACNCVPVFADIDPLTGNLTAETIAARLTPRTRAVIVVHLFGRPARLRSILSLLEPRGIPLIEDCAQAHLAEYGGQFVGTHGHFGCFSFQQSKQITCGDGGITLINRLEHVDRARRFVDKGWNRTSGIRSHEFLGMNYRMTELQAAVALAQLRRLPRLMAERRSTAEEFAQGLRSISGLCVPDFEADINPAWWMFNFVVDEQQLQLDADTFVAALQAEGVPAKRNYLPRPLFDEELFRMPNTYGQSGFPLPTGWQSTFAQFEGLSEFFARQVIVPWNSRLRKRHVTAALLAVKKIASAVEAERRPKRSCESAELVTSN